MYSYMLVHINNRRFTMKPSQPEVRELKWDFTDPASIVDLTIEQIAECLISGKTIQP